MKAIFSLLLITLCLNSNDSFAQLKDSVNCPTLSLVGPKEDKIKAGQNAAFKLMLKNVDSKSDLTYNWTVSNGTIIQGQGTHAIIVDTKGLAGEIIATTVEVSGLHVSCDNLKSAIINVIE